MIELSNEELIEEIKWSWVYAEIRRLEKRYDKQSNEEQRKEYVELHNKYTSYFDEAVRHGLTSY